MTGRRSAWLLLAAFALVSAACVTWNRKDVKTLTEPLPEGKAVLSVVKNDGHVIEFTKRNPGRVRGYTIVGSPKDAGIREVEIAGPFTSIRQDEKGRISELVDGQGRAYIVQAVVKSEEGRMTILGTEADQLTIPLKEIATVQIRQDNALPITAILIGALVVVPLTVALMLMI